jgi:formate hydrogenlyase subunit 6/NADH:ubiquinone oxidoreductase subunit I
MKFEEWVKSIIFYEILLGMKATLSHLLSYKPITLQYPHEKKPCLSGCHIIDFGLHCIMENFHDAKWSSTTVLTHEFTA